MESAPSIYEDPSEMSERAAPSLSYSWRSPALLWASSPTRFRSTTSPADDVGAIVGRRHRGVVLPRGGLVAWRRRPDNRLGPLMVATCFALLARQLRYSHDELAFTIFFLLGELGYALYVHVVLAYPRGRVTDRLERLFLGIAYAVALAFPFASCSLRQHHRLRYFDPARRESLLLVSADPDLVALQKVFAVSAYGVARWSSWPRSPEFVRATTSRARSARAALPGGRRRRAWAVLNSILTFAVNSPHHARPLLVADRRPDRAADGAARRSLARTARPRACRRARRPPRADAPGDSATSSRWRSTTVRSRSPSGYPSSEYVDAVGTRSRSDRRARARGHGSSTTDSRLRFSSTTRCCATSPSSSRVAAAARLALVNARLHAEVRAQLEMVQESRARIVTAADEERRRIERDLHDGGSSASSRSRSSSGAPSGGSARAAIPRWTGCWSPPRTSSRWLLQEPRSSRRDSPGDPHAGGSLARPSSRSPRECRFR